MTYDRPTPQNQSLSTLTQNLSDSLTKPIDDQTLLLEQAILLNDLFKTVMHDKINTTIDGNYNSDITQNWIHFSLRIQKQCTDTIKARSAIDYMQSLSAPRPLSHAGGSTVSAGLGLTAQTLWDGVWGVAGHAHALAQHALVAACVALLWTLLKSESALRVTVSAEQAQWLSQLATSSPEVRGVGV